MTAARFHALRRASWTVLSTVTAAGAILLLGARGESAQPAPGPPPITISPAVPVELNAGSGGAPRATLEQAAAFAWQEFIALNWPAMTHTTETPLRDTPDTACRFGATEGRCGAQPLVWQTFRGKAEIFPARPLTQLYDSPPDYDNLYQSRIPACRGFTPSPTPSWVNLDETTEIGLAAMYSGVGIPTPTAENSAPQLVRFMAKANRAEFNYVNLIGAQQAIPTPLANRTMRFVQQRGSPPAGSRNLVSLPNNTIEIKAGWRQLNPATEDVTRFHTARVRYYEIGGTSQIAGAQCYREAVWGLVSLHIIQKTASAPYFIFATFEQADNIRTADGTPTEDADGNIVATQPCRGDQTAPCPTTPTTHYQDSAVRTVSPRVSLRPAGAAYCTSGTATLPRNRLYYLNSIADTAVPNRGFICINARQHPIPPAIIAANQAAHAAIDAYNRAHGIVRSPWSYYKLINVQFRPMTLPVPGQPYTGPDVATFYQANSVVESNHTLQNFSGRLVHNTGTKTDYASQFGGSPNVSVPSMYYRPPGHNFATRYDMGGCMGCHATAQRDGGDFSFILLGGAVTLPEAIPRPAGTGGARIDRARALITWSRPRRARR